MISVVAVVKVAKRDVTAVRSLTKTRTSLTNNITDKYKMIPLTF
jgi:hypothetical protein